MTFDKSLNKRIAQEVITEALLWCNSDDLFWSLVGLVDMALELGLITKEKAEDYKADGVTQLMKGEEG